VHHGSSCLLVYENASASVLQDNCLDLVLCAFLRKLSGCVINITVFCQDLLRLIKSAVLANTDISVKPKYLPNILVRLIYRSISSVNI